jgi:hypothetical protein
VRRANRLPVDAARAGLFCARARRFDLKHIIARIAAALALSVACKDGTGGGQQPDYALLLAPAALNVAQGAVPTVAVTIDRTNFTGGVALFLTGAPAQVTGSFFPATTNTTSSTLTVTVGSGATPGTYTLVVNGNGAPGARTTNLPLTVTAAPNYTLELTPGALTIARGASDSTALTITRSNFTGAVTLGLTGAPAGVTSAFNPAAPTTSTSRLTITVGAAVTPGMYTLTVTGNATIGDRTAALTLTVP